MTNDDSTADFVRWINWKTVLLAWVFFAIFLFAAVALTIPFTYRRIWLVGLLAHDLIFSLLWALATPLVLKLARHFFVSGRLWVRHVIVHVAASAAFSVLTLLIYVPLSEPVWRIWANIPLENRLVDSIQDGFSTGVMYYAFLVVIYHALHHADEIRKREVAAARIREKLNNARLEILQARLQPHFLFNTLHTIGTLIRRGKKSTALNMLSDFGDLLRYSLQYGEHPFARLADEVDFARRYLRIMQRRFPDRLRPSYSIDADTGEVLVPTLLLQPLIENAVQHGIAKAADAGCVEIVARHRSGRLDLEVRDDGPGLSQGWQLARDAGFGLSNIQSRLELHYGDDFQFEVADRRERGVAVRLSIPSFPPAFE